MRLALALAGLLLVPVALAQVPAWTEARPLDDCGSGGDAWHMTYRALRIEPGRCKGFNEPRDIGDRYVLAAAAGMHVRITTDGPPDAPLEVCFDHYPCYHARTYPSLVTRADGERDVFILVRAPPHRFPEPANALTRTIVGSPYVFDVSVYPPPPQDDCGSGRDAATGAPVHIALGVPCGGGIGELDPEDVFTVDVPATDRLDISIASEHGRLCVQPPNGGGWCLDGRSGSFGPTAAGRWSFSVSQEDHGYTWPKPPPRQFDYTVAAHAWMAPPQDDCGSGADAPDQASDALLVGDVDCLAEVRVHSYDRVDWYAVDAREGETLRAIAHGAVGGCLHRPDGSFHSCEASALPVDEAGRWLFSVSSWRGTSEPYRLVLSSKAEQDDCGAGGDASARRERAHPLGSLPVLCQGELATGRDAVDWYSFPAHDGQAIQVALAHDRLLDAVVCIWAPDSSTPAACGQREEPVDGQGIWGPYWLYWLRLTTERYTTEHISYLADATGDWTLSVRRESGKGPYALHLHAAD